MRLFSILHEFEHRLTRLFLGSAGRAILPVVVTVGVVLLPVALTIVGWSAAKTTSPQVYYLPAAAHTGGFGGTNWRTDLELHNPGYSTLSISVEALRHGQANPSPIDRTYEIPPEASLRLEDVLLAEFGLDGTAALRLTADGDLVASSRTFTATAEGTYGQGVIAVSDANAIVYGLQACLTGLHNQPGTADGYRTNLGLLNATGSETAVKVELFKEDGTSLGIVNESLAAYEYLQLNRVFEQRTSAVIRDGWAMVWSPDSGARFLAYASVVDNRTGDPVYVAAVTREGAPSSEAGIAGTVTEGGLPATGVRLGLILEADTTPVEIASTTTDAVGRYFFADPPTLGTGESYYVQFGPNEVDPDRLYIWYGKYIHQYASDGLVAGGDFDIANIDLLAPPSGAEVDLPETFAWVPRDFVVDNYEWVLSDPFGSAFWRSGNLGSAGSDTLTECPAGFVTGHDYAWWVLVWGASDSYGESYEAWWVNFSGAKMAHAATLQPRSGRLRGFHPPWQEHLTTVERELQPEVIFVPGCAHTPGAAGTQWQSDLVLHNPEPVDQTLTVQAIPEIGAKDVGPSATVLVPAGASAELQDVLWALWGITGSATIQLAGEQDRDMIVGSRTYNFTDDGTYGQLVPGCPASEAVSPAHEARLVQLSEHRGAGAGSRTNLGLVNVSSAALDVQVQLYTADGTKLGSFVENLPASGYRQIDRVFRRVTSDDIEDGYAVLRTNTEGGAFFAYASVIDNLTGDPVYIPAARLVRQSPMPTPTPTPSGEAPQLTWVGGGDCYTRALFGVTWLQCISWVQNDGGSGNVELTAWAWTHPEEAITEVLPVSQGERYMITVSADLKHASSYMLNKLWVSSPDAEGDLVWEWGSFSWCLEGEINSIKLEPDPS